MESTQSAQPVPKSVRRMIEAARYRGPSVTIDQLVGVDAALRQLAGQLAMLERPEVAARQHIQPSGTLFLGEPGTGKTLLVRYLSGRLEIPLYQFSADEFDGKPGRLHDLFGALQGERALLFIDEISILAQQRRYASSGDRRMLAALLTCLDGLSTDPEHRLWVIGACTPDIQLDAAIYRSGRLGVVVEFVAPSEEQRVELFELYLRGKRHSIEPTGIARLALMAVGATGADIHDWIHQAVSEALADDAGSDPVITQEHLERVVARRGFVAAERPGREPLWATALHESAHAVIAYMLFGRECLAKLSLGFGNPRGDLDTFSHGHFALSDDWLDVHEPTNRNWPDYVAISLAGACAEEAILGEHRQGGRDDITKATAQILSQFDTGDESFGPSRNVLETSVGADGVVGSEIMRSTTWFIARSRFDRAWDRTIELVTLYRAEIESLGRVLFEEKVTLTGGEIADAIDGTLKAAA